jgi:hypothetical protein
MQPGGSLGAAWGQPGGSLGAGGRVSEAIPTALAEFHLLLRPDFRGQGRVNETGRTIRICLLAVRAKHEIVIFYLLMAVEALGRSRRLTDHSIRFAVAPEFLESPAPG